MRRIMAAVLLGALFSVGLAVSGMTQPEKVVGFLDVAGDWDPSLAFVTGGAIMVKQPFVLCRKRLSAPLFGGDFRIPPPGSIDARLLIGASLFGIGWGLTGFCPGPALTALGAGDSGTFLFVAAMLAGMAFHYAAHTHRAGTQ